MSERMMAEFKRAKARHDANPSKPIVMAARTVSPCGTSCGAEATQADVSLA